MILLENPLKIKYKFIRFEINNETIEEFQLMERSRMIRKTQVHKLKRMIIGGNHFDSPIIINDTSRKKRIIDGQHRLAAIREILSEKKEFKIIVLLVVYKDLSRDEEKDMFLRWNSGTRQSSEDYIQICTDEIPIYDWLEQTGMVSVYREEGKLKFRQVVQPYILSQARNLISVLGSLQFITEAKRLKKEDFERIIKYIREFKENLKEEVWNKTALFTALMYVYFTNKCSSKRFWELFKKVESDKGILEWSLGSGREIIRIIKKKLEQKMFGKKYISSEKEVIKRFENTQKIWTDDKIEFLKENYEETFLTIDGLLEKFNEEFNLDVSLGNLKGHLTEHHIKKAPEVRAKMIEKELYIGRKSLYTKKILELCRKWATSMTKKEVFEKIKVEAEQPISYGGFSQKMTNKGIKFIQRDELMEKCDKKTLSIIKKNIKLELHEIRDKIIEQTGKEFNQPQIKRLVSRIKANQEEEMIEREIIESEGTDIMNTPDAELTEQEKKLKDEIEGKEDVDYTESI